MDKEKIFKKYELTNDELNKMYQQAKFLIFSEYKTADKNPKAIVTGGQPGAGKSAVVIKSKCDFAQEGCDSIILDVDTYRGLYKNSIEIAQKYPDLYSEITDGAVGKIMQKLIDDAIQNGYNFIFEGTMGKSPSILEKLKNSSNNYSVVARLMAVSREESLLSIFERFLEMRKNMGMGRLTSINAHDVRYEGLLNVAQTLEQRKIEVEVYERGTIQKIPKLTYKTSSNSNIYGSVYEALINGRNESRKRCMLNVDKRLESINYEIKEYFENDAEIMKQLDELNKIIEKSKELLMIK